MEWGSLRPALVVMLAAGACAEPDDSGPLGTQRPVPPPALVVEARGLEGCESAFGGFLGARVACCPSYLDPRIVLLGASGPQALADVPAIALAEFKFLVGLSQLDDTLLAVWQDADGVRVTQFEDADHPRVKWTRTIGGTLANGTPSLTTAGDRIVVVRSVADRGVIATLLDPTGAAELVDIVLPAGLQAVQRGRGATFLAFGAEGWVVVDASALEPLVAHGPMVNGAALLMGDGWILELSVGGVSLHAPGLPVVHSLTLGRVFHGVGAVGRVAVAGLNGMVVLERDASRLHTVAASTAADVPENAMIVAFDGRRIAVRSSSGPAAVTVLRVPE